MFKRKPITLAMAATNVEYHQGAIIVYTSIRWWQNITTTWQLLTFSASFCGMYRYPLHRSHPYDHPSQPALPDDSCGVLCIWPSSLLLLFLPAFPFLLPPVGETSSANHYGEPRLTEDFLLPPLESCESTANTEDCIGFKALTKNVPEYMFATYLLRRRSSASAAQHYMTLLMEHLLRQLAN